MDLLRLMTKYIQPILYPLRSWMDHISLMALSIMAILAVYQYSAGDIRRWVALTIMVTFAYGIWWLKCGPVLWKQNVRIAILALMPLMLEWLNVDGFTVVIMYFILSSGVMEMLPPRLGYLWICFFGLLTVGLYFHWIGLDGLLNAVGTFAGYLFFGSTSETAKRAAEASRESRRLLGELQEAHRELQERASQAEELAASEERNRLAREVHDTLGHRLTVAAVQLEGAQRLVKRNPGKAEMMIDTVRKQVLEGLSELRRTVATLRAPLEEDLSLSNALTRLASSFEEATGVTTYLSLADNLPQIPDSKRHAVYRVAQESLTNIQRHAQAEHAWLRLDRQNGSLSRSKFQVLRENSG
ncbi:sensor histidine kinase [Chloroflexi bacterium TSY]|nr:sensor histidine kinase [Chloroflexi bacterium TSY]